MNQPSASKELVHVEQLKKEYPLESGKPWLRDRKKIQALDGLTFSIYQGETLAIVGESGCGKTTLGRTLLQITQPTAGKIVFNGVEITHLPAHKMRPLRTQMQMIFQNPYSSLNPRMTVGEIISEGMVIQRRLSTGEVQQQVGELMQRVGLSPTLRNRYPHEFSSGQRQRIGIARAISLHPQFIICDEPISALDVSIQAQIINLLMQLQSQFALTYLYISHDLSMVQYISNRVAVMYRGKFMELGKTESLFRDPVHPYTQALLSTAALPYQRAGKKTGKVAIVGEKPPADLQIRGCKFQFQCPIVQEICKQEEPAFQKLSDDHFAACHRI